MKGRDPPSGGDGDTEQHDQRQHETADKQENTKMTATMEKTNINFEQEWDVEVSAPSTGTTFLRLKTGESAVVRVLSKPYEFKEHWHDGRSVMCGMTTSW